MKWFKNLKISLKLIITFLLIAAMAAGIGIFGIISLSNANQDSKNLFTNFGNSQGYLGYVNGEIQKQRAIYRDMLMEKDAAKTATYANMIAASDGILQTNLQEYQKTCLLESQKSDSEQLAQAIASFVELRDKIVELCKAGSYDAAYNLLREENSETIISNAINDMDKVTRSNTTMANNTMNDEVRQANQEVQVMIIIVAAAVVAAVVLGLLIARMISRPLKKMTVAANKLAVGDTDVVLDISMNDEVGMLSKSFESVVMAIRSLIDDAKMLRDAALEGRLATRADADKHEGDYKKIVEGVNDTLDAVMAPLNIAAEQINQMAYGENVEELDAEGFNGDFKVIINNLNLLRSSLHKLLEDAQMLSGAAKAGEFSTRADLGRHQGSYRDIIQGVNDTLDTVVDKTFWYESLLDAIPLPVSVTDMDMNWTFINKATEEGLGVQRQEIIGQGCENWNAEICNTDRCGIARLNSGIGQTSFEQSGKNYNVDTSYIYNLKGEKIGHIEVVQDVTKMAHAARYTNLEVEKLHRNLELLAQGQLKLEFKVAEGDEYTVHDREVFQNINSNFETAVKAISGYLQETATALGAIAEGNVSNGIESEFKGDFAQIKDSINTIITSLNKIIGELNNASMQVASGTRQVSEGSQTISQGATEQASSIEELTDSITQIAAQTKQNAMNANKANELAIKVKDDAAQGNEQMKGMLQSMEEINESSANISKIIKVIDDIAFQTNILALNAAVEAARAGVHGKGFAVVAEEVRNLAARSADAAKETTSLIEGSIKKADVGTRIASKTADALTDIVSGIEKAVNLVGDIAIASNEQATGIAQINKGIEQMSQVVQANSATAEEAAAASEELSGQAQLLKEMVGQFKLKSAVSEHMTAEYKKEAEKNDDKKTPANKKASKPQISLNDNDFGKY